MANLDHVKRLKQGKDEWNNWREKNPKVWPDLCDIDLVGTYLSHINLSHTNLSHTNLIGTDLSYADLIDADLIGAQLNHTNLSYAHLSSVNLSHADLSSANLIGANLSGADLSGAKLRSVPLNRADLSGAKLNYADLSGANLDSANLNGTNLSGADLSGANLSRAKLSGADFHATHLSYTIFAEVDLSAVEGLDSVIYEGPSTININTVHLPEGETRTLFLRGAAFSDTFIDYLPSLLNAAIQYESCFISYAHQDEDLARRLYKDLQDKGVRCWFAPRDLKPGTLFHRGIEDAIHVHERVLLLLSEHAVKSNWVAHEVETTLNRQARERRDLLFPLRLDEAVLQAKDDWAARLRESRHIGDFTNWQDDAIYRQRFAELLRHLKVKTT